MDWDSLQVPSPKESMHHELLMQIHRNELAIEDRNSQPSFEVAAWLKLKNTEQLPSILLLEYTDRDGEHWEILDTATISSLKSVALFTGAAHPNVNYLKEVRVYLCHPNPFLDCQIEELRFNNKLVEVDYLEQFKTA